MVVGTSFRPTLEVELCNVMRQYRQSQNLTEEYGVVVAHASGCFLAVG